MKDITPENLNIYNASIYVRISKEDGDKIESDSIGNQKALLRDFLKTMPDIGICSERVDDGFSGVSMERPALMAMLADIDAGLINCVVVKDFSRFSRNYIDAGRYIQILFPKMGVRFISVTDNYDSAKADRYADNIIIPFKNMINDAYCADLSIKIRSQLDIKRKKGDFIGAFAVYGYLKSKENKNKLVVDEYAAEVVKDIFKWKLEGMSLLGIADRLNSNGILSPMEYKRSIGLQFHSHFKTNCQAKWSAVSVSRILKNEVYTGRLEQGKKTTPNYKIKKQIAKPKSRWICVENTHEAIISKGVFETANVILKMNTRVPARDKTAHSFSGVVICGGCLKNMVRKTVPRGRKKYYYYSCTTYKKEELHSGDNNLCAAHSVSETRLEQTITKLLVLHLNVRKVSLRENHSHNSHQISFRLKQIAKKEEEIERYKALRLSLYEDFKSGVIEEEDYSEFKAVYEFRRQEALAALAQLTSDNLTVQAERDNKTVGDIWGENIDTLSRRLIVELVDKIYIYGRNRIEIVLRYRLGDFK